MKFKITLLCLAVLFCSFLQHAIAQDISVSGKVKNKATGDPLQGATITNTVSNKSTVTDASGSFSITVAKGAKLVITYTGMTPFQYQVNKEGSIEISLEESNRLMNEVVVVGYGVQRLTKISGAISAVKAADIQKLNVVRPEEALQGTVSGVNVMQAGTPGSKPFITVRGMPSYTNNGPLVVVDGVPQTQDDLNAISPADIESISVLKDGAATAIYGVKGGNGVIVVTTKGGRKNQKAEFTINSNYGIQEATREIPVLSGAQYAAIVNEASLLSGGNIIFPDIAAIGKGTDWQDEIFKKAPMQSHSITARGGSDKITYFLSGSYLSQGGIVGGYDKSRFNRINVTSNLSFDLTTKLKFLLNASYVNLNSKGIQENSFNSIIGSALNYDPTVPVYNTVPNTVGTHGFSTLLLSEVYNPLTKLDNTYNQTIGNKIYGKFEFQYQVIKNLKLTTRLGYAKYYGDTKTFTPLVFWGVNNVDNTMLADGSTVPTKHNSVSYDKANANGYVWELFGNYDFKVANDHTIETVLGMSIQQASGNSSSASRQDVPYNSWQFADFSSATGVNTSLNPDAIKGGYGRYSKNNSSYFGRINYDYKEKYLASVSTRIDGSTVFGSENKYGIFPSGSLGWVVTKENFFQSKMIDLLKIRGSYGATGNDGVDPQYSAIQTDYLASLYSNGNSIGYTYGNSFVTGASLASLGNENLKWEANTQLNVGFDVYFLKNKFNITADYYQRKTNNLLYKPDGSLTLGAINLPYANIGSTKNSGVDILLGYKDNLAKDLRIMTNLTFTSGKNMVTETNNTGTARILGGGYFNGQAQTVTVFEKGKSPGYFYGYKTAGLFQSQKEINDSPTQNGAQPGDIKFVDINGDGVIDVKDQTEIGNPFPKFTMGWTLNLEYKNFDLSVFTYVSEGNDIYRAYERNANYTNKFQSVLNRWTGPGTTNDARYPRYSFIDANNNSRVSDRYVEDGSFIKIKNILLGYNIQARPIKKIFKSLRIYGQVKNAFTFTKYSGFDPEIGSSYLLANGVDLGAYPQSRTYSIGLDIKF